MSIEWKQVWRRRGNTTFGRSGTRLLQGRASVLLEVRVRFEIWSPESATMHGVWGSLSPGQGPEAAIGECRLVIRRLPSRPTREPTTESPAPGPSVDGAAHCDAEVSYKYCPSHRRGSGGFIIFFPVSSWVFLGTRA